MDITATSEAVSSENRELSIHISVLTGGERKYLDSLVRQPGGLDLPVTRS